MTPTGASDGIEQIFAAAQLDHQAGRLVERKHPPGEQRLWAFGSGKPTLQVPALFSSGFLKNSTPDLSDGH